MKKAFVLVALLATIWMFIPSCKKDNDANISPQSPAERSKELVNKTKAWLQNSDQLKNVATIRHGVTPHTISNGSLRTNGISSTTMLTESAGLDWDNALVVGLAKCAPKTPDDVCVMKIPYKPSGTDATNSLLDDGTNMSLILKLDVNRLQSQDPIVNPVQQTVFAFETTSLQTINNVTTPVVFDNYYAEDGTLLESWRTVGTDTRRLQLTGGTGPASPISITGHMECNDIQKTVLTKTGCDGSGCLWIETTETDKDCNYVMDDDCESYQKVLGGGSGFNTTGIGVDFEFYYGGDDGIKIDDMKKFFSCFGTVPDNGAKYSMTICVDIPVDNDPSQSHNGRNPGHVFISLQKENGNSKITKCVGFYPVYENLSISMQAIASKTKDNGGRGYDASMTMNNISAEDFQKAQNMAIFLSNVPYDLNEFNCTNYALGIFNSIRDNPITVPDWNEYNNNWGATPVGLFKVLSSMQSDGNIKIGASVSAPSQKCN
jgi:hypothetical protein